MSGPVVKPAIDPWNGKRNLYEKYIEYQWKRASTEREIERRNTREWLGEWKDGISHQDLQSLRSFWHESLDSYEERIKVFISEVQEIIDEKITENERYNKRSYETFLRIKGLAPYAPQSKVTAEDVKSKVAMQDLAGRYVELRKSGSNFVCRCPFHDDKHPSACVYTKSNTFKCFTCGEYHDVIGFLMKIENLTFLQALNQLNNNI